MRARSPLQLQCRLSRGAPSGRLLTRWARAALGSRGLGRELALQCVTSQQMRHLNHRYRGKDKPTNVLAFPALTVPGAGVVPLPLGDVVICPSVLRQEARQQGKTVQAHWAHLVVHGALHLIGYDHEKSAEAQRMERREVRVLRALGFQDPYRQSLSLSAEH